MRAKKIVNQSSDFLVRRTGSYRHKKALGCVGLGHIKWTHGQLWSVCLSVCLSVCVSVCLLDETMSPK